MVRNRGLSTIGSKTELIAGLDELDPERNWTIVERENGDDAEDQAEDVATLRREREGDLFRCKKKPAERETEILRNEMESMQANVQNPNPPENVRQGNQQVDRKNDFHVNIIGKIYVKMYISDKTKDNLQLLLVNDRTMENPVVLGRDILRDKLYATKTTNSREAIECLK